MNPMRYKQGGDKYQAIKFDERMAFYERVEAEEEQIREALRNQVESYVEYELELNNKPDWRTFVDRYREWDRELLYPLIDEEIEKAVKAIEAEVREGLSRVSSG